MESQITVENCEINRFIVKYCPAVHLINLEMD